jgi:hypothetical protein
MRARTRRRAAAGLLACACLLAVAACGDPDGDEPRPSPTATATAAPTAEGTGTPTLDPDHVMAPIGPRTGEIGNPDILITSSDTLDEDTVAAVAALEGVRDVEVFSMTQVIIENESYNLAAVDPATYRNYTLREVAETQEVWDRIAGGELGLRRKVAKRIPQDANQFVTLGSTEDARAVHVGAIADTVVEVDAVVNETWVDDLGMVPDNALLVRTGSTAPQTLRTPIEDVVGDAGVVSMVDAIALNGLDPDVKQVAVTTGTVSDVVGVFRYSVIGGGRIAPEPSWVASHIETRTVPILGQVTCNKYLFPQLEAALRDVIAAGLQDEIHPDEYAGCYYPRFIAGTTKLSNHSFGLALDLNVPGNQRGTVGEMDRGVVAIFKHWGFGWGGDWAYTDPMHFEMVELKTPENP